MARTRIYIPEAVKDKIREHLNRQYPIALAGYISANEDEDTLTGDLFGTLRIANQKVEVVNDEIAGPYSWSINYTKFRGRGGKATEKAIGADGIIVLELDRGYRKDSKSILFQSKHNRLNDKKLITQCAMLTTWREAAFVLNYGPHKYEAFDLDYIFESRRKQTKNHQVKNIAEYLGSDFLNCLVGDSELMYSPSERMLRWKSMDGLSVATKFSIPHRLTIGVKAPIQGVDARYDKLIKPEEVHNYRMEATADEILSLPANYSLSDISKAKKKLALAYHPDGQDLDELARAALNRRMQEINSAHELKRKSHKDQTSS